MKNCLLIEGGLSTNTLKCKTILSKHLALIQNAQLLKHMYQLSSFEYDILNDESVLTFFSDT